jgi:hypothetical protein
MKLSILFFLLFLPHGTYLQKLKILDTCFLNLLSFEGGISHLWPSTLEEKFARDSTPGLCAR